MSAPSTGTVGKDAGGSGFSLWLEEAIVVVREMRSTGPHNLGLSAPRSREEAERLIREIRLEAALRDAASWWGEGDPRSIKEAGSSPTSLDLPPEALAPLVALLRDQVGPRLERDIASAIRHGSADEALGFREELRSLDRIRERLDADAGGGGGPRMSTATTEAANTGETGSLFLTRSEAEAVALELEFTGWDGDGYMARELADSLAASTREEAGRAIEAIQQAARRLQLETAIRDAGGWWKDSSPDRLVGLGQLQDTLELTSPGVAALAEFYTEFLPSILRFLDRYVGTPIETGEERRHKAEHKQLAARLGVAVAA